MSHVRVADIPAWYAKELIDSNAEPEEWALWGEVNDGGSWRRFRDMDDIDAHFGDWIELSEFCEKMVDHNVGFTSNFSFHRVRSDCPGVSTKQLDPMFHAVMSSGYSTLHELRTIYSLHDVYLMVDSIMTTRKNEQIAMDNARNT